MARAGPAERARVGRRQHVDANATVDQVGHERRAGAEEFARRERLQHLAVLQQDADRAVAEPDLGDVARLDLTQEIREGQDRGGRRAADQVERHADGGEQQAGEDRSEETGPAEDAVKPQKSVFEVAAQSGPGFAQRIRLREIRPDSWAANLEIECEKNIPLGKGMSSQYITVLYSR